MMVEGIFCDILLTKLEFYGVTDTSPKLIKSYLEGRYQRGILNNNSPDSCSNGGEIKHGVSQVGPLLSYFTLMTYQRHKVIMPKSFYLQMTV
jgi:hypothetical protein